MYLVRLVYTSLINENFSPQDIAHILESAKFHNKRKHLTGVLCFNRKIFLQCLEGSRANVNDTYHRILNDHRHKNIVMLDYQEIAKREFQNWSMGYIPESEMTDELNIKYSGNNEFNPYEMSGESAHQLMIELSLSIPTQD